MRATMSVLGMLYYDENLLDDFQIPDRLDREYIIDLIMGECGELMVIYPQPTVFKKILKAWSSVRLPIWNKLIDTTEYEYDPIYNYDRREIWTEESHNSGNTEVSSNSNNTINQNDTRNTDITINRSGDSSHNSDSDSGSNTTVNNTQTSSSNTDHQVTGFNGGALVTHDKDIVSGTVTDSGTTKTTGNSNLDESSNFKDNETHDNDETYNRNQTEKLTSGSSTDQSSNGKVTHDAIMYGNIGVTTTQQMIQQEREIVNFSVGEIIVQEFIEKFCLGVYLP